MTSSAGWLWAPGYPTIMGLFKSVTGFGATIKGLQVFAALVSMVLIYLLVQRVVSTGDDVVGGRKAARLAAWVYAVSPPMVFFAVSLWSEVLYGTILLGGILLFMIARDRAKESTARALKAAVGVGLVAGVCVLVRGVATYMLAVTLFALIWRRWNMKLAWAQVAVVVATAMLTVAPYSAYATQKFGTFIISDRTMGQMMWLGNNDFEPITFDYGNGQLSRRAFNRAAKQGRKPCASRKVAIERDSCQTERGVDWIKEHPQEFLKRMPMRVAQLLNPHSLFARHLRWGKWKGLPQSMDEALVALGALISILVMWGGAVSLIARGRGGRGVLIGGLLVYHVAAISVLAGLSRYRIPLEPLLLLYAAWGFAKPGETWSLLKEERWRMLLTGLVLVVLMPLVLWYLPTGWPSWRSW